MTVGRGFYSKIINMSTNHSNSHVGGYIRKTNDSMNPGAGTTNNYSPEFAGASKSNRKPRNYQNRRQTSQQGGKRTTVNLRPGTQLSEQDYLKLAERHLNQNGVDVLRKISPKSKQTEKLAKRSNRRRNSSPTSTVTSTTQGEFVNKGKTGIWNRGSKAPVLVADRPPSFTAVVPGDVKKSSPVMPFGTFGYPPPITTSHGQNQVIKGMQTQVVNDFHTSTSISTDPSQVYGDSTVRNSGTLSQRPTPNSTFVSRHLLQSTEYLPSRQQYQFQSATSIEYGDQPLAQPLRKILPRPSNASDSAMSLPSFGSALSRPNFGSLTRSDFGSYMSRSDFGSASDFRSSDATTPDLFRQDYAIGDQTSKLSRLRLEPESRSSLGQNQTYKFHPDPNKEIMSWSQLTQQQQLYSPMNNEIEIGDDQEPISLGDINVSPMQPEPESTQSLGLSHPEIQRYLQSPPFYVYDPDIQLFPSDEDRYLPIPPPINQTSYSNGNQKSQLFDYSKQPKPSSFDALGPMPAKRPPGWGGIHDEDNDIKPDLQQGQSSIFDKDSLPYFKGCDSMQVKQQQLQENLGDRIEVKLACKMCRKKYFTMSKIDSDDKEIKSNKGEIAGPSGRDPNLPTFQDYLYASQLFQRPSVIQFASGKRVQVKPLSQEELHRDYLNSLEILKQRAQQRIGNQMLGKTADESYAIKKPARRSSSRRRNPSSAVSVKRSPPTLTATPIGADMNGPSSPVAKYRQFTNPAPGLSFGQNLGSPGINTGTGFPAPTANSYQFPPPTRTGITYGDLSGWNNRDRQMPVLTFLPVQPPMNINLLQSQEQNEYRPQNGVEFGGRPLGQPYRPILPRPETEYRQPTETPEWLSRFHRQNMIDDQPMDLSMPFRRPQPTRYKYRPLLAQHIPVSPRSTTQLQQERNDFVDRKPMLRRALLAPRVETQTSLRPPPESLAEKYPETHRHLISSPLYRYNPEIQFFPPIPTQFQPNQNEHFRSQEPQPYIYSRPEMGSTSSVPAAPYQNPSSPVWDEEAEIDVTTVDVKPNLEQLQPFPVGICPIPNCQQCQLAEPQPVRTLFCSTCNKSYFTEKQMDVHLNRHSKNGDGELKSG